MSYVLPTPTDYVSSDWADHAYRSPPSSEPGTDYACGYGSAVYAAGNGVVSDLKWDNGGGTGRYCTIDLDDGRRTRTLHMSEVWVNVGQRVNQGNQIGLSGASGYGDDWYYGPHAHQTLWPGWYYDFCSTCTIDFAPYVGPGQIAPNQRTVGANGANGRSQPNTQVPVTQSLPPGTVATMSGWMHGENVDGNTVWYRGEFSGDWFWSGGFNGGSDATGIPNVNPPTLEPYQRYPTAEPVNGRSEPNTSAPIVGTLFGVGNFDGWINGQSVEGEVRWLRNVETRGFYSLKYLSPPNTDNLADLNPVTSSAERTAGESAVNVRQGPFTSFPVVDSIAASTTVEMNGWTVGEDIQGIEIWYRIKDGEEWAWAGGFTSQSTDGLEEIDTVPVMPDGNNPRGLPEYPPVNPAAVIGLQAPLGYNEDGSPASRGLCGDDVVDPIIDRAIIHHTGTTVDQLDYFSYENDRSSCPTWYVRPNGDRIELIRPGHKPASTGPEWNCRSVAWEVLDETGAPNWLIPDLARQAVAEDIAWLAGFDGKELDGVPVSFTIDAEHVIGHNQALPGTECPGPDMDVAGIIEMALAIFTGPPEPCPDCPECPDPEPGTSVSVPVSTLTEWQTEATETAEEIGELLEGETHARR